MDKCSLPSPRHQHVYVQRKKTSSAHSTGMAMDRSPPPHVCRHRQTCAVCVRAPRKTQLRTCMRYGDGHEYSTVYYY